MEVARTVCARVRMGAILAAIGTAAVAAPAAAAPGDPVVQTFSFTGDVQTFVVPDGVTFVDVTALGAGGGTGFGSTSGGRGGFAQGRIPVDGGDTLTVVVGGRGGNAPGSRTFTPVPGGFNGGGASQIGANGVEGGGGGGASDVRTGAGDRVVVAGGGGGGGADVLPESLCNDGDPQGGPGGVGGGLDGADGSPGTGGTAGGGGKQNAGGGGGNVGTSGAGGDGDTDGASPSGGGGGGGYFGGGGGRGGFSCNQSSPGGGGGSGFVGHGASGSTVANEGALNDGQVTLSYVEPAAPSAASASTSALTFPATAQGSTSAPRAVTVTNTGGRPLSVTGLDFTGADAEDFFVGASTCSGPVAPGQSCDVGVRFAPQASAGARAATLRIHTNAASSPTLVNLSGTATAPARGPAGPPGPPGPRGPAGASAPAQPASVALASRKVRLSGRKLALRLRCVSDADACSGTAKVRTRTRVNGKRITLRTRAFQGPAGEVRRVVFTVPRALAARIRKGNVSATVFVVLQNHVHQLRFTITRPRS